VVRLSMIIFTAWTQNTDTLQLLYHRNALTDAGFLCTEKIPHIISYIKIMRQAIIIYVSVSPASKLWKDFNCIFWMYIMLDNISSSALTLLVGDRESGL